MNYPPTLTDRQQETLYLVQKGFTETEIAEKLGLSRGGVRFHVEALRRKFGCTRKAQLIRAADGALDKETRKAVYLRIRGDEA